MQKPAVIQPPETSPSQGALGVQIFFTPTRSIKTGVHITGVSPAAGPFRFDLAGLVGTITWARPVAQRSPITIQLDEQGGESIVAGHNWITASSPSEALDELWRGHASALLEQHPAVLELTSAVEVITTVEGSLDARFRQIEQEQDAERKAAMRFFVELDIATNPELWHGKYAVWETSNPARHLYADLPAGKMRDANGNVGALLRNRELAYLGYPERPASPSTETVDLPFVSGVFRALLTRAFPGDAQVIDLPPATRAFELFASGQLRYELVYPDTTRTQSAPATNGEPDSAAYFQFADLAIECLRLQIDTDLWSGLAPCLLYTRELFCPMYCDPLAPAPGQGSYKPHHYEGHRAGLPAVLGKLPALRAAFAAAPGLNQLIAEARRQSRAAFAADVV